MNEIQRNLPVDQQLEILRRGVVDLVSEAHLKERLSRGTPLRVKLGADPTRPDLHLGHAVILRKMRQFQDLGHKVIMLIGDFTATIGDPTGKSKTRPPLTLEEARANAESYLEQCRIILRQESEVLEVRYNSEWLEKMGYKDIIQLASRYTVARIMERDDFRKRFEGGVPISMHELLYPLTQGYDSVALEADIELGGTDQLFNNLVGRALQRDYGQSPQIVMTLPLLVGLDGSEKMSKSLDNYIGLTEAPEIMYEKLMKVPDNLLKNYLNLLTDFSLPDIEIIFEAKYPLSHRTLALSVVYSLQNGGQGMNTGILKSNFPSDYNDIFGSTYGEANKDSFELYISNYIDRKKKDLEYFSMAEKIAIYANLDFSVIERIERNMSSTREIVTLAESIFKTSKSLNIEISIEQFEKLKNAIALEVENYSSKYVNDILLDSAAKIYAIENKENSLMNTLLNIALSRNRFENVTKGGIPKDIPTISVAALSNLSANRQVGVAQLVAHAGLEPSNGAARKLIQNRGLKINGEPYIDPQGILHIPPEGLVLQKGKDKFVRVVLDG